MPTQDQLLSDASIVENQYKQGLEYKKSMGFLHKWPQYERFKSGDQWPKSTERTRDLPRPVINIIRQIENHKVASVMNENIKMVFSASEMADNEVENGQEAPPEVQLAEQFTRYADTIWENIKQQQLNEEALESASNIGTGIWHYYYDTSKKGGVKLPFIGQICGETIDAVNFFPGNPQNANVEQQPYIIITYRDLVSNVQNMAKNNGIAAEIVAMIKPDSYTEDQAYDMAKKELTESDKVTVLHKYWKENGTVWFTKVAGGVVVTKKTNTQMKRYPIAVMQWDRRKRSIFGVGDTEGLIPNQRIINFLTAMQVLSVQLTGWPKLLIDRSRVKEAVSNKPGEIINVQTSEGVPANSAVQYMNPAIMPATAANLVDNVISYTRDVAGANESALGQQDTGQLNASAIMMLQKASGVPLESIKRRFYQAMEDIGRIWAEIWRIYYNTDRMITTKTYNGDTQNEVFKGSHADNVDMNMKIDIGPSSSYSETLMMTSLDNLFNGQHITLQQYLTYAPQNVIPFKDRLLKSIQDNAQENMQQAQQDAMIQQQQTQEVMAAQGQQMAPDGQSMPQDMGGQISPDAQQGQQPSDPFADFKDSLSKLPKKQQDAFFKKSKAEQLAIIQQHMQQGQAIQQGGQSN